MVCVDVRIYAIHTHVPPASQLTHEPITAVDQSSQDELLLHHPRGADSRYRRRRCGHERSESCRRRFVQPSGLPILTHAASETSSAECSAIVCKSVGDSSCRPRPRVSRSSSSVNRRMIPTAPSESSRLHRPLALELGATPPVGPVGDRYDNALAEDVNGLFETELIRRRFSSHLAADWCALAGRPSCAVRASLHVPALATVVFWRRVVPSADPAACCDDRS